MKKNVFVLFTMLVFMSTILGCGFFYDDAIKSCEMIKKQPHFEEIIFSAKMKKYESKENIYVPDYSLYVPGHDPMILICIITNDDQPQLSPIFLHFEENRVKNYDLTLVKLKQIAEKQITSHLSHSEKYDRITFVEKLVYRGKDKPVKIVFYSTNNKGDVRYYKSFLNGEGDIISNQEIFEK